MSEPQGYLALVLHAHLPYVRHPEHPAFLEEDWLYEAITETYVPLVEMMEGLVADGVPFRLTMSITPPLAGMLADPLLQERYLRHIDKLIELAAREVERTRWMPEFHPQALRYQHNFSATRRLFADAYDRNLLKAFRKFQDLGVLEIITCGATHGFLPLMVNNRNIWRGQIQTAVRDYEHHFGRPPRGIWLPECGYEPPLEEVLKEAGLRFFILDTHGIMFATPRPRFGVYAPVVTRSGVAAFGRDLESSKQVWSANEGYPGDFEYREFYRDIGWDLEYEYVRPYLHGDGQRSNLGIKYYRITGPTNQKEPYSFERATEKAAGHAGNFMFNREKQVEYLHGLLGRPPVIVAPYDAELFGHWWYEGPQFLNFLLRKTAFDQQSLATLTLSEYLERFPVNQLASPATSSWGYKGYAEVWLDGSNDWIYRHLHAAGDRLIELANAAKRGDFGSDGVRWRALRQAAREFLLAQSSDWAFIMKTGTMVPYAVARTREHIVNFTKLYEDIRSGTIDEWWLGEIEQKNNIFSEIDPLVWAD
ncbi:MAG: 1,4-alpha-glucan branching protein domain-containing protein [Candidatus Eisenbacteria bacterium]